MFKIVSTRNLLTVLLMIVSLPAKFCDKGPKTDFVYITDVSASVEKESIDECFKAFEQSNRDLKRGSRLAFIPVTSDAAIDAPGRIKRFEVKEKREAYDDDRKRLMARMKGELAAMREAALSERYRQTDLIGAIAQAGEEFAKGDEKDERRLVVLSDFLQDDRSYNFLNDGKLRTESEAAQLAREVAASRRIHLRKTRVYLGLVRSRDLQSLSPERRLAVMAFWKEFLMRSDAASVEEATDGPGLMARFIQQDFR